MENLRTLFTRIIKIIFPFLDFAYIAQLENYQSSRIIKQLFTIPFVKFFKRDFQKHDKLVKTARIKILIALSLVIYITFVSLTLLYINPIVFKILSIIILTTLIPIYITIATFLTQSLKFFYTRDYKETRRLLQEYKDLQIIGITGSYGKTTTKYLLNDLLKYNYKVQYIPDNLNTKIGISRWINQNLKKGTLYLIIEMGAYSRGEIASICKLTTPSIALITSLGDQHLERFGSFENLVKAKTEIFANPNSKKYITHEAYTKGNLREYKNITVIKTDSIYSSLNPQIHEENIAIATEVAKDLKVREEIIKDTIKKFVSPSRRNNLIERNGLTIIDNSYNISPNVAKDNIKKAKQLAEKMQKELIVITAGIPETGKTWREDNQQLGKLLNTTKLILLKSVYHKEILKGYGQEALEINKDMQSALDYLSSKEEKDNYLVLMLPELSDLSY